MQWGTLTGYYYYVDTYSSGKFSCCPAKQQSKAQIITSSAATVFSEPTTTSMWTVDTYSSGKFSWHDPWHPMPSGTAEVELESPYYH